MGPEKERVKGTGGPMTRIILIDPKNEIIIHSIAIESKGDGQRLDYYWHKEERERKYEIDRVLVSCGTVRLMARDDPICIPLHHAGQSLDGGGVTCPRVAKG
jgi:hypothetical protein